MADYQNLKDAIKDVIKTNGNQEITGQIMQNVLLSIINSIASGRIYQGVAIPTTNPGTLDTDVFYIAIQDGLYSNFGGLYISGQVVILQNTADGWEKVDTNIAQADLLNECISGLYSAASGENIPINLSYRGYFNPNKPSKELVSSTTYYSQIINVSYGEYYRLSIKVGTSGMAGVVFFNGADQNVGIAIIGDSSEHINQTVKVPFGATQMAVATARTFAGNKIEKVTLDLNQRITTIENTLAEVKIITDQILANLILNNITLRADDTRCFYDINKNKNEARGNSVYTYMFVDVNPGEIYQGSARIGTGSMALFTFWDDEGNVTGYAGRGQKPNATYENLRAIVPDGTTQMGFAWLPSQPASLIRASMDFGGAIMDLNARVAAMETTVAKNNDIITDITEITSKNVFPGDVIGGYVNSTGGFSAVATQDLYAATDLIPVKPNTYYYISNRNVNGTGGTTNIRCLDENKTNPTKVRAAATGEECGNWYTPNAAGTAPTNNGQIKTSPTAAYLQMNLKFNYQGNPDYQKLMLQEVGDTYDPSFVPSPYQPYAEEYKVKKSAFGGAIMDLNARVAAMETTVAKNNDIITDITEITSKNVFPGDVIGGYVNSTGGFSAVATQDLYAATDLIPVKPNTYYYISNRNVNGTGGTTNIRCLDENKTNPTKVRAAATGEECGNWYTPNAAGTAPTNNGQIKTSPTAAYLQMNLKFNYQGNPDYQKLMLQEVGDTYDPSFVPSPYQPYAEEYKVKKSALPDNIGGGGNIVGTVSLNNTPMFLLVGASHGEGYGSVKDKAFISYLSAMLDWSVENYSRSGSDYIEHFNSLEIGQQISNVYPGDMAGGIALVVLGGNESNYFSNGVDGKYFRANIIRCCSALKALGYRPILASHYGDMGHPWSLVVREVAREYGYLYYDLNGYGSRFYSTIYRPWWYNAHYATRTNVIQWYSFMKLLADIERPQTALKIFRNRNPYTQIDELLFDNNIEKMRYWRELTLHHVPLKPGFEKYVDRLDLCVYTNTSGETVIIDAVEGVQSEYNIARKGGTISMDDTGLLQFTFPAVGKYLTNVKFHIESDDTLEVYIRKYIDPSLRISLFDASAAFGITTATPNIVVGDVYTDSNNPGVNFTVTQYTNGTLIATPNGSFTAPGNTTGTLTRTSGTGTATLAYNTLRTAPGATYFANAFNKLGKWEALNGSGGVYELKGLVNYLDYDRCDILVKKSGGGAFVLKNVSADYEATQLKDVKRYDTAKMLGYVEGDGTQILTKTTFENPQEDWGLAVGKGVVWDGKVTYTDGNDEQQTGNHIPTYFSSKKGVTQILRLEAGDVLTQALPTMQGARNEVQRYKLKLTARYYPTEALDINSLPADVRTSQTFDFARIDVRFVLTGTNSYYTRTYYAPLNWVDIEDELVFDASITVPNQIQITAVDNRTEFMLCEIIKQ